MGKKSTAKYQAAKASVKDVEREYKSMSMEPELMKTLSSVMWFELYQNSQKGPDELERTRRQALQHIHKVMPLLAPVLLRCQKSKIAVEDYGQFLTNKAERYKSFKDLLKKKTLEMHQKRHTKLEARLTNLEHSLKSIVGELEKIDSQFNVIQ